MNAFKLNPIRPLHILTTRVTAGSSSSAIASVGGGGGGTGINNPAALFLLFSTSACLEKTYHYPRGVKRHENDKGHPTGHGEKIWIYNHIVANHVVWSFTPDLRSNKSLRQLPYTGKKLVPAGLRKDYWRPMAVVEFGRGNGPIGRSVYAKCRELKKRHELEWEDERLLNMSREQRGRELNDQKGNAIADLAYVLAGKGKGNRMLERVNEGETEVEKLHEATVYWASEQDQYFAESWSHNVTHVVGLPAREWVKKFGAANAQSEEAILKEEGGGEEAQLGGEKVAA